MKKIIRAIDPSLHFIRRLRPSSLEVYQVKKDGRLYVLKTTKMGSEEKPSYSEVIEHFKSEEEVLEIARGVQGITHLVKVYEKTQNHNPAMLKEFYEGKTLAETDGIITNARSKKKLENTVRELHSLGIARLDLSRSSNIVISHDGEDVCLIDLGYSKLSRKISPYEFKMYKEADLAIARRYFSK